MTRVLVLGAGGFSGRHLGAFVRASGLDVELVGVDKSPIGSDYDEALITDLGIAGTIEKVVSEARPDRVINLAAVIANDPWEKVYFVNAELSRVLLDVCAERSHIKRVVLVGSAAEYGHPSKLPLNERMSCRPVNNYGLTKHFQTQYAEYYARHHGVPVVIARTFNIVGPGMSASLAIPAFAQRIRDAEDGGRIATGNLAARRDYLAIQDVCAAYWALLTGEAKGLVYNVCSGFSVSMREILDAMVAASGKHVFFTPNADLMKEHDVPEIYGNNLRLRATTDWLPRSDIFKAITSMMHGDRGIQD